MSGGKGCESSSVVSKEGARIDLATGRFVSIVGVADVSDAVIVCSGSLQGRTHSYSLHP